MNVTVPSEGETTDRSAIIAFPRFRDVALGLYRDMYTPPHPWESRGEPSLFNPRRRRRATDVPDAETRNTVSSAKEKKEEEKGRTKSDATRD